MRRFWCASVVFGAVVASVASVPARVLPPPPPPPPPQQQGPGVRITYRVQLVEGSRVLASGEVSGPSDTRLRLGVRTDVVLVEALLSISSEGGVDSVSLSGDFFSRRLMGRSRRGLPLWEEDTYQRAARLAWGDTARILPFGGGEGVGGVDGVRLDLIPIRAATGGETRPTESVERGDSGVELTLEAVVRPRRVAVTLTLAGGGDGATSVPRSYDLVPDAPSHSVLLHSGETTRALVIALVRPEPPRAERDRALALDADIVCLRVLPAGGAGSGASAEPARELCGRLNNVARRLVLSGGDTLVATFAWPGAR